MNDWLDEVQGRVPHRPKRRWWAVAARPAGYVPPALDSMVLPAAAYSLRQLRSAYVGPTVNIRRSSDNATQDIGFRSGDFDLQSFNSFVGGGNGFVTIWYDQSSNANNATEATAANQPQLITSVAGLNGRPGILFSGSDLGVAPAASINNIFAAGGTIVTVINQTAAPVGGQVPRIACKGNAATVGWLWDFYNNPGNTLDFQTNWTTQGYWDSPSGFSLSPHCVDAQYSSTAVSNVPTVTADGSAVTLTPHQPTGTYGSDTAASLFIGNTASGGTGPFTGHIVEVVLWNSMPALTALRANVKSYWGTP